MQDHRPEAPRYEVSAEDVEYYRHGGGPLMARLHRPHGTGPFPAVVEIHGGAWVSGTRLNNEAANEYLAASGIIVMALDFRMPPEAPYPASIADINAGTRWLKARAASLGSRPGLVGGYGASSGGHQLMLSAMRPADPRYAALPVPGAEELDASLAFAVACWPVIDPLARYRRAKERGVARLVESHDAYWRTEAAMSDGNPQLILDRGEAASLVPTLIIHGTADENVAPAMIDRFVASYRRAGGAIEVAMFEGQPHTFITNDPSAPASQEALARIASFMRQAAL